MSKNKRKQNKLPDAPKPIPVTEKSESDLELAKARENICYEYGVCGLDTVDCDILLSLENEKERHAYLKQRFPEGI